MVSVSPFVRLSVPLHWPLMSQPRSRHWAPSIEYCTRCTRAGPFSGPMYVTTHDTLMGMPMTNSLGPAFGARPRLTVNLRTSRVNGNE